MIGWASIALIAISSFAAEKAPPVKKPQVKIASKKSVAPTPLKEKLKLTQSAPSDAPAEKPPRSQEWKRLPRQPWEQTAPALPPEIDRLGFDRRSIIRFKKPTGFDLPVFVSSERMPLIGQITGAKSEGVYISMGDLVYLRSDDNLQVGETYAITQEPYSLRARKSNRLGYSYMILGKVKVTGVKDGFFIGIIQMAREFVSRGASLVAYPPRIRNLSPIPGPEGVEGVIVLDRNFSTYTAAQHKLVAVDRGTQDGVQPGMVFRAYEYVDPSNNKRITNADIIPVTDILVIQVTKTHCMGLIIQGHGPVYENNKVILLTDVSDLKKMGKIAHEKLGGSSSTDQKPKSELDELDQLDAGGDIGRDEEKELKQLERWKTNPNGESGGPDDEEIDQPVPGPVQGPMEGEENSGLPSQKPPSEDAPAAGMSPSQSEIDDTSPITPEIAAPAEENIGPAPEEPATPTSRPKKESAPVEEPEFPARTR